MATCMMRLPQSRTSHETRRSRALMNNPGSSMSLKPSLLVLLGILKYLVGLLDGSALVNDGVQGFGHGHGIRILPNVPSQVDTDRPLLHAVMHEFKNLRCCLPLRPTGHDHGNRTSAHHLVEVLLAPVSLHDPRTDRK